MTKYPRYTSYHAVGMPDVGAEPADAVSYQFNYNFQAFYHPFIGQLIQKLNNESIAGMLDPDWLANLSDPVSDYVDVHDAGSNLTLEAVGLDASYGGPYGNYNWELFYHIPVAIAVHLSSNQRFAEAQKWFHLVFDPTTNAPEPTVPAHTPADWRFWRSFVLRSTTAVMSINALYLIGVTDPNDPSSISAVNALNDSWEQLLAKPFDPFVVARERPGAFQWYVVMKYLDNLIAWGDSLFLQDTVETLNEATLCYVLASDILGARPQAMPPMGTKSPYTYKQIQDLQQSDGLGDILIDLESDLPFDTVAGAAASTGTGDLSGALFGIGRALYFCIPQNATLMAYWDTVADRLFKIRNSENIEGVAQQLPLFDPPLDPGMLVRAAAAGIDIGSIVSGLNQPIGPVRSPLLIQKALEIAAEVRSLGNSLLGALEKGDAEHLATLRQGHEIQLQTMMQTVRFLQWQHAQETTNGLLKTRATALERYTYYLRLLGVTPDPSVLAFTLDRTTELNEQNFTAAYATLVAAYDQTVGVQTFPTLKLAGSSSSSNQSGATGAGTLFLNMSEDDELNTNLPDARNSRQHVNVYNTIAGGVALLPSVELDLAFWGLGAYSVLTSGPMLAQAPRFMADIYEIGASVATDKATMASKTAAYQRRADDWRLQANLAARDLMQIGRQVLASLIAEQVAQHDYETVQTQVAQAQEVQAWLQTKFTSEAFYIWMQSGISGLYYQYYRFACDTARKAEQTMKQELMRPELDDTTFIQFNYWNTGFKGLLSGEALYLDIKRMELAYHDSNKRELELTKHISLRQLSPTALINLKATGKCTLDVPEWLFDRDCPGHYFRRVKTIALSIPSVVGPYTSVNCSISLQASQLRVSPLLTNNGYARMGDDDPRFQDYFGATDVIVTSSATNDAGMFETNLHEDRFLPFEGAGAISTWNLALPSALPTFDYSTITDVILHMRYTARDGGDASGQIVTKELVAQMNSATASGQFLMFDLRYDFPTEWAAFQNGTGAFTATILTSYFPYAVQLAKYLTVTSSTLYGVDPGVPAILMDPSALVGTLGGSGSATLTVADGGMVLDRSKPTRRVYLVLQYDFGASSG